MSTEKAILLSVLELTQKGPVQRNAIAKHAKIPRETAEQELRKLCKSDLFDEHEGLIDASPSQRVGIAVQTLKSAADFERVCQLLSWKEFEIIVSEALEKNDYRVLRNFHFKRNSKRREIDIVGLKKPLILCIDCKHWKRGWRTSAITKAVQAQTERTEALAQELTKYSQKAGLEQWKDATLIPIMMSLIPGPRKFFDGVPVVSVLQLQDFINELPTQAYLLKSFHQKPQRLCEDLRRFCPKNTEFEK